MRRAGATNAYPRLCDTLTNLKATWLERRVRACSWGEFVDRCRKEPELSRVDEGALGVAADFLHDEGELVVIDQGLGERLVVIDPPWL